MGGYAWVTLATNNSYSLGALVLAHSLKKSNTAHKLVVLITSSVSESMRNQLNTVFDVVRLVDVLDSKDEAHLALMQRPELGVTFTKIHCWRLIEFEKCVFLDADTLVVRNCDELFEREEFSAAPDASWPDCFNSGVFVFRPSIETFNKILQFAVENKSFDGGDQGLLNQFFSSWATEDIKKHLPFVYNLTSIGPYSYIPAFKHYGSETRIVHFIGTGKPWLQQLDVATKTVTPTSGYEHLGPLLQQWWDLFCEKVHPNLDKKLESSNEGMSNSPVEACSNSLPIALTDEQQTFEPCTPYREIVFMPHSPPFQPFNVKASSGESPHLGCFSASVFSEQLRPETNVRTESETNGNKSSLKENEVKKQENYVCKIHERIVCCPKTQETEKAVEKKTEEEKKEQISEEEPPPKDPFNYESFYPDETCIKNYLEQNVVTYQLFDCHQETKIPENRDPEEREPEQNIPPLPRFLTIPEDDRRQTGNNELMNNAPSETYPKENLSEDLSQKKNPEEIPKQSQREPTAQKEEPVIEKRELTKSKSMPFLPFKVTEAELPPTPPPPRSIWKSQPNVNVDPNRKYSMPKLKPILPKQNSFSKSISTSIPKVTHYTEFVMSSEYKDPIDLPKDRIGFVATYLHKESKQKRKSNVRSKFGPLPFITSPEEEKPAKKIRLEHLDNDLYDLTQLKRQSGNRKKPKEVRKKETGNSLEEILKRLREYSKDYQHYFGVIPKPRKKTVIYKNAVVQATGVGECRTSEPFKRVRTFTTSWSRGTQTTNINKQEKCVDGSKFSLFRNYVKASQKELLKISGRAEDKKENSAENEILTKIPSQIAKKTLCVEDDRTIEEVASDKPKKSKENETPSVSEDNRKITENEDEETQKIVTNDIVETQKTSKKYKNPGVCKEIKTGESLKLQSMNSARSENEEEAVTHSKSDSTVAQNQQENPSNDATTSENTEVSLNLEKPSCTETNEDGSKDTQKEQNFTHSENEEPVMHSKNHLDLISEQNQVKRLNNDFTNIRSTDLSTASDKSYEPTDVLGAKTDSENQLESFCSVLEQNQQENPSNDATTTQNTEVSLNLEKPSCMESNEDGSKDTQKEQNMSFTHSESEEPVMHSKNRLDLISEQNQLQRLNNDFTNIRSTDLFTASDKSYEPTDVLGAKTDSENQLESFIHSGSVLEQNQEENQHDCVAAHKISMNLEKTTSLGASKKDFSTGSPKIETPYSKNETKSVVHSNNLSTPVHQETDDFTNIKNNGAPEDLDNSCVITSKDTHSGNQTPNVVHPSSVLQQNHHENLSGVVTTPQTNGISLLLKKASGLELSKEDFNPKSPTVQSSHLENEKPFLGSKNILIPVLEQRDRNDVVSETLDKSCNSNCTEAFENNVSDALVKNLQTSSDLEDVRTAEDTKAQSTNDTKPVESEINNSTPVFAQKINPSEDVKESPKIAPIKSSPVVVLEQNGHTVKENGVSINKPQEEEKIQKITQEPKKPEEILCVPDFETPRSSRVSLKTVETELEIQKTTKVQEIIAEVPSNDSPDEAVRLPSNKNSLPSTDERLEETKNTSGIAGAIAQLSLQAESQQTPESIAASAAHQEYLRRQNWETGNIDYMGRDSFDNIWSKICQTLEAKAEQPSVTGEVKKPSTTVTPSPVPPNVPEFIETLPGKPAPGPVEEDEIIFSKPDSRQSGLSNISEEEEIGGKGVKLSDILKPVEMAGEEAKVKAEDVKKEEAAAGVKSELPVDPKAEIPTVQPEQVKTEIKAEPVKTEVKPEPTPASSEVKTEAEVLTEIKSPLPPVPTEVKPQLDSPPSVSSDKSSEEKPEEAQPQRLQQPEKKTEECKVVALPSPPILPSGPSPTDKTLPKSEKPQDQPQVQSEPIPLPPPTPHDQNDPNQKA